MKVHLFKTIMRTFMTLSAILCIALPSFAQNAATTRSGRILDENGEPLVGVSVLNGTTKKAALSDLDGRYSIEAKDGDQLTFAFLGMENAVLTVGQSNLNNIVLKADSEVLEDAIVTGYQTISRERATGSYAIVNSKILEQKPTANIASALQGLVPGLQVQSAPVDGQTRYIIRGQGTLQSSQTDRDPLIVVDGFPINGYSSSGTVADPINDIKDPFATINPNDVESITVLKDAAATSIYGARAANGVIVITTKKGKDMNKVTVSVDATVSVSEKADIDNYFNMASAANQFRYLELANKYSPLSISSTSDPYQSTTAHKSTQFYSQAYRLIWERDQKANITDSEYANAKSVLLGQDGMWMQDLNKHVLQNTIRRQYNIAVRSASEKVNNSLSIGYNGEDGYLQGNGSDRVQINLMNSTKLTRKLTFNANLVTMFSKRLNNGVSLSSMKNYLSPWSRLVDENGGYIHVPTASTIYEPILRSEYADYDWDYNPVVDTFYTDQQSSNVTIRTSGGLDYVTDWGLKLSAKGQYERRFFTAKTSYDEKSFYVRDLENTYEDFERGGVFSQRGDDYSGYNLRFQADYNKTFADKHNITALAGTEVLSSTTELVPTITRYGYNKYTNSVARELDYVSRFDDIFGNTGSKSINPYVAPGSLNTYSERFFSVYANAAYTYDNRYSLTASFRTDASNYQSLDVRQKFSPFWSVGASWNISKEEFMKYCSAVNLLKLRASYGIAGVAAGKSETSSVTTISTSSGHARNNYESYSYIPNDQRGNSSLTWEKSRTLNVGVDYGFFGNKLFGSVDFYNRFSYDVLSPATVPVICQGITKATYNNAEVLNRGVEVSVGTDLKIAGDLRWNGMLNYSYNSNKVTKFLVNSDFNVNSPDYMVGYPISFVLGMKPSGYTPEGLVMLQGKDGSTETIVDKATSHYQEILSREEGDPLEGNNWIYYMGCRSPKHELSFSNSFSYKGLTLSFMITGRFGYVFRKGGQLGQTYTFASFSKELDNSFKVYDEGYANQSSYTAYPLFNDANYPLFINNEGYYYMSMVKDLFSTNILPGAHIRLNEVYLGYDLPSSIIRKQNVFSRVNVFAQASNLGIIWSKSGMDPDYPVGVLKPMATYTFGLKLNF